MTTRGIPRFVKVMVAVVVVGTMVALAAGWQISKMRQAEEQRDCERSVTFRADTRAMWLYLLDTQVEDPDDPKVVAFEKALDRLVPELHCVDGNLIKTEVNNG